MAEELELADVVAYNPELIDPVENARLLATSLDKVRRYCGWHVSPVRSDTFVVDGGGWPYIVIPTLKVDSITSCTEDGVTVPVDEIEQYTNEPGILYRKDGFWRGRVVVTVEHGFAAAEAMAFREEVLALIDRTVASAGTGLSGQLTGIEVDDVSLRASGITDRSWGIAKQPMQESVLYQYRLIPVA
jgi:hypothetical protein